MTIRERVEKELFDLCFWENEATQIVELATKHKSLESMLGRWNDDVESYPPRLLPAVMLNVRRVALDWIDANHPDHIAGFILRG